MIGIFSNSLGIEGQSEITINEDKISVYGSINPSLRCPLNKCIQPDKLIIGDKFDLCVSLFETRGKDIIILHEVNIGRWVLTDICNEGVTLYGIFNYSLIFKCKKKISI